MQARYTIKTERLVLVSLDRELTSMVRDFRMRNREFHAPWTPLRNHLYFDERSIRKQLHLEEQYAGQKQHIRFAILPPSQDTMLGSVNLNNIVFGAFQSCHLGYSLDEQAQGNGYMREALAAAVDFAFSTLKLHRVEANIMPRNDASIRVVEKLGFEREGYMRKYLRIHGNWEDHLQFVKFNE